MDRDLPDDVKRRGRIRRIAAAAIPLVLLTMLVAWLPAWVSPALHRARIRTAIVSPGPLEAVIEASGTVVPEVERVLTSPIDTRLLRVLKRAGMPIREGEPVAELDLFEAEVAWNRLVADVRIADNEATKAEAALARQLSELDARIERTQLDVEMLGARAERQERLFAEGLASQQAAAEARLAARQAIIEAAQLRRQREHVEREAALESASLASQRTVLRRQSEQARRLLDLGTMGSDRAGVVTWVLSQEGSLVRRGDPVARIADLGSFLVEASVSDVHAARVRPGLPVFVQIDEVRLEGSIVQVAPSVEGGVVRFQVALRERSHPRLRPDASVEVLVITERKARTLKVRRGPFDDLSAQTEVFVIRGDRAVRRSISLGIRGRDEVETLEGVGEGDEIVISDVREYLHFEELEVR